MGLAVEQEIGVRLSDTVGLDLEDSDAVDTAVVASALAIQTFAVVTFKAPDLVVHLAVDTQELAGYCSSHNVA